jgi:glycosyltransferase involved in cell wall biosynthesis
MNYTDIQYSTTRMLRKGIPQKSQSSGEFEFKFLSCPNPQRKGEGGLRTQNLYKRNDDDRPLITIVTVVFNGETHVEQTILSVINQDYDNVEYIIIDGGSSDRTIEIIKNYDNKIDYWISEPDVGISDAFNKGIALAHGEWIGIINADDWYEHDAISRVARLGEGEVAFGNVQCWTSEKKGFVNLSLLEKMNQTMALNHPAIFVKRSVYGKYGGFCLDYKYAMDYEFLTRILCKGVDFKKINHILSNFRTGGASGTGEIGALKEVLTIKDKYGLNNKLINRYQYIKGLLKSQASRFLKKNGFVWLIKIYSKLYSPYKA